jgi:hypothetical protein
MQEAARWAGLKCSARRVAAALIRESITCSHGGLVFRMKKKRRPGGHAPKPFRPSFTGSWRPPAPVRADPVSGMNFARARSLSVTNTSAAQLRSVR